LCISTLHDDLLLQILARLGCATATAHTYLLSHLWHNLWTCLPKLVLRDAQSESLCFMLARLVVMFEFDPEPGRDSSTSAFLAHRFSLAQIASLFDAAAMLHPKNLTVERDMERRRSSDSGKYHL